ncbi:hypothetical protein SAMN05660772_02877 [Pasteurella testudinis DSM 23072]|uniref:Uncharacterized protein n=1 Tax=Pasteurella testudinis DSM 23072 TaxID=1122938 RepID=A0A1W1V8N2_9PAST|nr:hypothetical protein SAMN05660772_02877 [Pasteurella testudinis DSM 23072]SUB52173.1 Uncharacterised protein [Pasteurella testudinis]
MINKIKWFWNYIFYFTWKTHCTLGFIILERPLNYIVFSVLEMIMPSLKNDRELRYTSRRMVLDDMETGINIRIVSRYFFLIIAMVVASFLSYLVFFLGWSIDDSYSTTVLFTVTILITFFIRVFFIEWYSSGYLAYFQYFERNSNKYKGCFFILVFYFFCFLFCAMTIKKFY